jgi:S-DNA-T family DNA segregation ATPase FtsK/SpoIIIE
MIFRKQNKSNMSSWLNFPPTLLKDHHSEAQAGDVKLTAKIIEETYREFDLKINIYESNIGPVYTLYRAKIHSNKHIDRYSALSSNLALNLGAVTANVRIDDGTLIVEVPNLKRAIVPLKELMDSKVYQQSKATWRIVLGKDVEGKIKIIDLVQNPQLLIGGQTGSGKSVFMNTVLIDFIMHHSPEELRLILIDPKQVEMAIYEDIPHLLAPVITEPDKSRDIISWLKKEMDRRHALLSKNKVNSLVDLNHAINTEKLPRIILMCDEVSDLMMVDLDFFDESFSEIAKYGGDVGIHLILSTSRVSYSVFTKNILNSIKSRVGFVTASQLESKIIINQIGAERLLGMGDMLFIDATGSCPVHIQAPYISDQDVEMMTDYIRNNNSN